ncbi:YtxH domain-containing protein [Staphylospora marina]|uniref:YtxH domain-containing protein n=1 Tax=Staphylospora marina TaxID=2490858 RepID=UPI000F5BF7C8|nr:YtxH domain-containing protein [Staphylospora marina]
MGKGRAFFAGALIGGIVGAAVALLTAPRPGRELREELGIDLDKAREKGKELLEVVKSQAGVLLDKPEEEKEPETHWAGIPLPPPGSGGEDSGKGTGENEQSGEKRSSYIELNIRREPEA